ncbi:helix-turn-helix domain-containing protein [Marivirga sp. S37H4]|uniref:Helix-turn-helix domain-containing protein n=1 Tax=Marivirga aurantiaca TaxID=2802615 RepID=A0A935C8S9_9BACT|nr:helix-turn-helix domain-containing protein [Marivirga aurantiaca]MBK6265152.1 helix-turn-helix domain-containing protein [Marivirga aurantiaca]
MKHVSILLLNDVNLGSMENARQGFLEANEYLKAHGKPEAFQVELVGLTTAVKLSKGLYAVRPDKLISEVIHTDMLIIPPVQHDVAQALQENAAFIPWIISKYRAGAEVVSLCLGAFILGSTGLLNGKDCVTHWKAAHQFQKLFPQTRLMADKLLTDEDGIYTGGGAFSSANLILYLIEKNIGREAAVFCSKIFQVDLGRDSQSPFIIFTGQKDHPDEGVKTLQTYIERNYQEKISVSNLCKHHGIGRRTLERRFKKATGNTVVEYLQRVKVEAAKRELEKGFKTVGEVMFDVGYSDDKSFRNVFRKYSGMSPVDYRMRYVKEEIEVV